MALKPAVNLTLTIPTERRTRRCRIYDDIQRITLNSFRAANLCTTTFAHLSNRWPEAPQVPIEFGARRTAACGDPKRK